MSGKLRLIAPLMCSSRYFSALRASRMMVPGSRLIWMNSSSVSRRDSRYRAASFATARYPFMSMAGLLMVVLEPLLVLGGSPAVLVLVATVLPTIDMPLIWALAWAQALVVAQRTASARNRNCFIGSSLLLA